MDEQFGFGASIITSCKSFSCFLFSFTFTSSSY